MLGTFIADPDRVESERDGIAGLGLLDVGTHFRREKTTHQVRATCEWSGDEVAGYEIHHGVSIPLDGCTPAFEIYERSGQPVRAADGARSGSGKVWGSNIHGLFDNASFRHRFLDGLWQAKGLPRPAGIQGGWDVDRECDRMAALVRAHVDMAAIYRLLDRER